MVASASVVGAMSCGPLDSRLLSPTRRPVGRFNAELPGVLSGQSLPAAEVHGIAAGHSSNGLTSEKAIQHVETDVPAGGAPRNEAAIDVVPQHQARAASQ